jgi:catalase
MSDVDELPVAPAMEVMERYAGARRGYRRAHARGFVLTGTFQATPEVRALTVAEHFQGTALPVKARLSNADGNPFGSDRESDEVGRVVGLGVRFHLPSGTVASWAAASIPAFPAQTPDDFVKLSGLRKPFLGIVPHPLRTIALLARRPSLLRVLKSIRAMKPVRSFATTRFNGVHVYYLVNAQGQRQAIRYAWLPRATEAPLGPAEARALPRLYLIEELRRRLAAAPVAWDLRLTLPAPDDPLDDASRAWPEERRTILAGTLSLTAEEPDQRAAELLVFDPTGVVPGIELSDDPLLRFRAAVYSESYRRRSHEARGEAAPTDMGQ